MIPKHFKRIYLSLKSFQHLFSRIYDNFLWSNLFKSRVYFAVFLLSLDMLQADSTQCLSPKYQATVEENKLSWLNFLIFLFLIQLKVNSVHDTFNAMDVRAGGQTFL